MMVSPVQQSWERLLPGEMSEAEKAFSTIFVSGDPYEPVFRNAAPRRFLLYPTDGYQLSRKQFGAVLQGARRTGDEDCYLIEVEEWREVGWDDSREAWRLALGNFRGYRHPPKEATINIQQHAMFSPKGTWGVLMSDEFFALVGGSREFGDVLGQYLGTRYLDRSLSQWAAYWADQSVRLDYEIDWLPAVLAHLRAEGR